MDILLSVFSASPKPKCGILGVSELDDGPNVLFYYNLDEDLDNDDGSLAFWNPVGEIPEGVAVVVPGWLGNALELLIVVGVWSWFKELLKILLDGVFICLELKDVLSVEANFLRN